MSFHSKQMRVPLRSQIIFKNIEITYQSELRFLWIYITENIKWGAHARLLRAKLCKVLYMMKALKETMIRNMYFSNYESCLWYGIILWGGNNESNKIFKLQKKVLRIISGVSNRTSCRQIFKDYNILTLSSSYILEQICFIKKYKDLMATNLDIHNHNTRRKLNLHVQHYNTVFKKSVINMGISLFNKTQDQTKLKENFKKDLKSFLLKHCFYSVDEFMAF
jgi:hypothetical protein